MSQQSASPLLASSAPPVRGCLLGLVLSLLLGGTWGCAGASTSACCDARVDVPPVSRAGTPPSQLFAPENRTKASDSPRTDSEPPCNGGNLLQRSSLTAGSSQPAGLALALAHRDTSGHAPGPFPAPTFLFSGMIGAFSLLTLRRKPPGWRARDQYAAERDWYERAQQLASFGSYRLAVDEASGLQQTLWSTQMYVMCGHDPDRAPPPSEHYIARYVHPDDQNKVRRLRAMTLAEHGEASAEYRLVDASGCIRHVRDYLAFTGKDGCTQLYSGLLLDIGASKQTQAELQQTHAELKKLARALSAAREENRRRVAREMHDDLGQLLAALQIDLSDLRHRMPQLDGQARERLDGIGELVSALIASVRRIVADQLPQALDEHGLTAALEHMAKALEDRYQIPCRLHLPERELCVAGASACAIYRIVQEALNNVVRHAAAGRAEVELRRTDTQLLLRIADDGIGMPPEAVQKENSFGLLGIRERVSGLGGTLRIESSEGNGTVLHVTLPAEPARSNEAASSVDANIRLI